MACPFDLGSRRKAVRAPFGRSVLDWEAQDCYPCPMMKDLEAKIRSIPDFPKKGILFRDITPLLGDGKALRKAVRLIAREFKDAGVQKVAAVEARGFIFGAAVAYELGAGFVPIRKPGKLPHKTRRLSYSLEYGTDTVEVHEDGTLSGERVLMVDDLLATGGTMEACARLVESTGAQVVGCAFVIELAALKGRQKLTKYPVFSLIQFAD